MIEDEIFKQELKAMDIKLTKQNYVPALFPHTCSMCGDDKDEAGYKRLDRDVVSVNTPYLFICKECYEGLSDNED